MGCGGGPAPGEIVRVSEDAERCSIHGMIAQDTDVRELESCGSSATPLDTDVVECLGRLWKAGAPVFVTLNTGLLSPPGALVGAPFDEEYGLRMYVPGADGTGSRSPVDLVMASAGATRPSLLPGLPVIDCAK